jgi:ABC-2 type transport system permease protein
MTTAATMGKRLRRSSQVAGAFLRIDYIDTMNYPLALLMKVLQSTVPVITFYFVAKLVERDGPDVAGDYFTFVVIGVVTMSVLGATLNSFGTLMLRYVQEGQLEMFLVEPIRWNLLPFVMVPWQAIVAIVSGLLMIVISLPLGAEYVLSSIPASVVILVLGLGATLAIGILGASIKVLAKRADPVLALYTIAASILSGAFFPIEQLPSWLRGLSWAIPHTYVIQALRKVLMPEGEVLPGPTAGQAMLALAAFCLVLYPIALFVYGRLLEYGRKIGALSGY